MNRDFKDLEKIIYEIQNQRTFTANFFKEYHDKYLNKEINISEPKLNTLIPYETFEENCPKIVFDTGSEYVFTEEVSYRIREYFGIQSKKEYNDNIEEEYNSQREILGILSREEFEKKYSNIPLEKQKNTYEFVPTPGMSFNDFCVLMNTYPNPKFILNPHIEVRNYSSSVTTNLQKIEIDLKKQTTNNDRFGRKLATKFNIQCKCGKTLLVFPSDIHSTITHTCGYDIIDGKEKVRKNRLEKSGLCPIVEKELWLYETKIPNVKDSNKLDTVYVYAMEADISPGRYIVDVWNAYVWDNIKKSYEFLPIILGYKKKDIIIDTNLITLNHPKAIEYCQNNGLPYARFLDVLFSIKDISLEYGGRKLDERGMLLQLSETISVIAKHLNSHDKFGVLSMGNKSLSKTYPTYLIGSICDEDFEQVGSSQDISLAGLRGGIDNHALINGKPTTMFVKGVFSRAGLCLFDEGEKFFDDADMNMVLKTFLDEYIDIKKIGAGGKIEQTYTPLIMSNFPITFSNYYRKEILKAYEALYKNNSEEHSHGHSKGEIASYINEVNLYLPVSRYVEDYKNQTLGKCIAYVRHSFYAKNIDWRTGGSLPASYRLLLDFVCWNVEEHSFKDEDRIICQTDSVLPSNGVFPTGEFIETLRSLYSSKINLKFEDRNDKSTIEKLNNMAACIDDWFIHDEKAKVLFLHLSGGTNQIDPKLNGLVYSFIKCLQICEDMLNHNEFVGTLSDNVKEWAFLILSKCKRGVTKDEYDFKEHYTNLVPSNEKFSMLEAEIEKIRNMEEEQDIVNKVTKRLESRELGVSDDLELNQM